jgi:lipoate-protein ligase A
VIHGSLIEALRSIGLHAKFAEAAGEVGREDAFLCFQRRTSGDVIVESSKICGSAQRRRRGGVLQHGGVLLAHSAAAPQLPGVLEVAGQALPAEALMELWLPQLRAALGVDLEPSELSELEQRAVERIVLEKHGNRVWIERR